MEATLTHKGEQTLVEYTSIFKEDKKKVYNLEENVQNEKGIDQYINQRVYQSTSFLKSEEISNTAKIAIEAETLQDNLLSFFSSYSNPYNRLKGRFETIQQWEGHIEEMDDEQMVFRARLLDLTMGGTDEYSEFAYEDIDEDDYDLMKEGAIFYFTIGKTTAHNGQIRKESLLKFKRLPKITQVDLNNVKREADKLYSRFLERRNRQ